MDPKSIGWQGDNIVISKHSGQHAISDLLKKNNINCSDDELSLVFQEIKNYTDQNNFISTNKVIELAQNVISSRST